MSEAVNFLCIGAPRAGTTWLWKVLKQHPGIWMPPIKELHYFDRSLDYPSPSLLAENHLVDRLFGKQSHHAQFRRLLLRSMVKYCLLPVNWSNLPWVARYLFGVPGDDWYLSLFRSGKQARQGEITPAYSILSEKDVRHVHELLPDIKIIYLIRNPVERAWSDMRFQYAKGRLDLTDLEQVIRHIDQPAQMLRSDYHRTISLWSSIYPGGKVLIGFFDDIICQPGKLVEMLFQFLEVDPTLSVPKDLLNEKTNAGKQAPIPPSIARYLAQKYQPAVEQLVPLVGSYTTEWMRQIETWL